MFGFATAVPALSPAANQALDQISSELNIPIRDRVNSFLRILQRWPSAVASLHEKLQDVETSRLHLTARQAKQIHGLDAGERGVLTWVLMIGIDPLGILALIPAGIEPFSDPALTGITAEPSNTQLPSGFNLTLIVKLTRHCSLRCTYCNDWREGPGHSMPVPIQRRLLENALVDSHADTCKIIWHGGEPSQLGVRRSLVFLWLQGRLRRGAQTISNSVQTNGAFLTEEIVDLWRAFGISVSVSLDGTRESHDKTRKTISGEGSFDIVAAGIQTLATTHIFSGALVVVTPEIAALDAGELIADLNAVGIRQAAFLPVRPSARDGRGVYLAPEEFAQFLIRVFDYLRSHPKVDFDAREIDALYQAYKGKPTHFCELNGPCLGHYFAVNPDGSVMHCDKFLDNEDYVLGNVDSLTFSKFTQTPQFSTLHITDSPRTARFSKCRWQSQCRNWCPHERLIAELRGNEQECCGLNAVFDHFERLEDTASKTLNAKL